MTDTYPQPASNAVHTLVALSRRSGESNILELLENAHAYFEAIYYDNLNGGTTTWALRLEVPVDLFAVAFEELSNIESKLAERLKYLDRIYANDPIGEVTITPASSNDLALGQRMTPSDVEVRRLWADDHLRLFLSHVSAHKVGVGRLKDALELRGISAFVAHVDIEPSREWQDEIVMALRSMHALAALVTPDFHASNWTDQEAGWALGRGIPALPVSLGVDPYGFLGKTQAIKGSLEQPEPLANSLVQSLLRKEQTRGVMRRALVLAFENAGNFAIAKQLKDLVVSVNDFTDDEVSRIRNAAVTNGQIARAHDVVSAIHAAFGAPVQRIGVPIQPISGSVDDVPF